MLLRHPEGRSSFAARWGEPLQRMHLDDELRSVAPPQAGAALLLLGLGSAEALGLESRPRRVESAGGVFEEMQIDRALNAERGLFLDPAAG